jgi:hypothetical protein
MEHLGKVKRKSANGYEAEVHYYEARRCEGCPLRGMCHQAKGNRRIEVNHNLNDHKTKARERLLSEKGLYHRSKRPVEVEAVFGQLKSNNTFTRFTLRSLDKVNIEFGLMALAHNLRKLAKRKEIEHASPKNPTTNPQNQESVVHFPLYPQKILIAA